MNGSVSVVGYRHLIEPPELGDCQDPECRTVSMTFAGLVGIGVLLVAKYAPALDTRARGADGYSRVCSACDERRLRAWLEDES